MKIKKDSGLEFKEFESAKRAIVGIVMVRMLQKGKLHNPKKTVYISFLTLAA